MYSEEVWFTQCRKPQNMVDVCGMQLDTGAIIIYLLAVNALTLAAYWLDKRIARRSGKSKGYAGRIPESALLTLALLGGSPAALFAQRKFRHKTRKISFQARYWIIVAAQAAGMIYYAASAS